jgi:DNA-directed RNA polymerase subunit RPC12/RpoP
MEKKCPKCDHLNHAENNRCWYCGFRLLETPVNPVQGATTAPDSSQDQMQGLENTPLRPARESEEILSSDHAQRACPNCGRNEIKADLRYGNQLKGREYLRQLFKSPIFWIGIALLILPVWIPALRATGQIPWRFILEALGFVLILISGERIYRRIFDPVAGTKYPSIQYTCLQCGHQWTSDIPSDARGTHPGKPWEPAISVKTIIGLLALLAGFSIVSLFGGVLLFYALTGCGEPGCPWIDPVIVICGCALPVIFAVVVGALWYRSHNR